MSQKFDMNSEMESAAKEYGFDANQNNSSWLKITEGDNKIRVLTPLIVLAQHYNKSGYTGICLGKDLKCPGCAEDDRRVAHNNSLPAKSKDKLQSTRNIKWLGWVIDYKDLEVKLAKLPHKVAQQLQALQNNPEYAFAEAPMPYDITINAKDAGKTTVAYLVSAARQNTPVAEEFMKKLERQSSVDDIKEKMKAKKAKELGLVPADAIEKEIDYPTGEEEGINPNDIPF